MPWNGSGVFSRLYSWSADAAAGYDILADRMDDDTNDIAQGLMRALTTDGQTAPTVNLPMAGHKHIGAAPAAAAGEYLTLDQFQAGSIPGGAGGGYLPTKGGTLQSGTTGNLLALSVPSGMDNYILYYEAGISNWYAGQRGSDGHFVWWSSSAGFYVIDAAPDGSLAIGGRFEAHNQDWFPTAGGARTGYVNADTGDLWVSHAITTGTITTTSSLNGGGLGITGNASITGAATLGSATVTGELDVDTGAQIGGDLAANPGFSLVVGKSTYMGGGLSIDGQYPGFPGFGLHMTYGALLTGGCDVQGIVPGGGGNALGVTGHAIITGNCYAAAYPGPPSDSRLKQDIVTWDRGLEAVLELAPAKFRWNELGRQLIRDDGEEQVGFIADEVALVIPEAVRTVCWPFESETTEVKTLLDRPLICTLVNAVQQLAGRVAQLEAELAKLRC